MNRGKRCRRQPPAGCLFLALCLAAAMPASEAFAETLIVVNLGPHADARTAGHSEAKVDWLDGDPADDTVCTHAFAALELQYYLRKATGRDRDFAIVDDEQAAGGSAKADRLLVGGPRWNAAAKVLSAKTRQTMAAALARLPAEGYAIRTIHSGGRRVIWLVGGGRVGTLYAAYDFLHRQGVRWFAPEAAGEDVPHLDRIADCNVTSEPDFRTRGFHAWENRGDEAFLLWMARNRLNYWCVEQKQHALMRKLGIRLACGAHDAQHRFLDPERAYPYNHPTFTGDETKPADPYPVGEAYRGDADADGTLTYFEAHPEWYPLVDGKRVPGIKGSFGTNYCTSNPHATAEFMRRYVGALADGPYRDADVVRFWTLDGGKWCGCPACKALGSPTDRNLRLVHHLDAEIKKARAAGRIHRPIIVRFLVYHDVLAPPTRPLPEGFDYQTCVATYFPICRSYVYPIDDGRSPTNARYMRQLTGWVREPDRHWRGSLCIGEYYNVSGYKCLPICFMHTMARDIPTYHAMGARHFHYMHVVTANMGNKALTNYQMARQLWDVKTDCEALWSDYFARRYGPAADTMRAFYESLETMLASVTKVKYDLARRLDRGDKDLFPAPELRYRREQGLTCNGPTLLEMIEAGRRCRAAIDKALAMDLPDRVRARIAEDERLFAYGERTLGYYDACVRGWQGVRAGNANEARRHVAEAQRLADLLKQDTGSTKHSSSHANAANAFEASRATHAIDRLRRALDALEKGR
ncbi:MAG: DUF4838 domain-containing protein [Planctomycetota bacterium]|nr:DUF4838 domain-containing protein [Planctomycetota bacterium]